MTKPKISRWGVFSIQACVPKEYTDEQAIKFAETENPCGTSGGWQIRTDDSLLKGDPVRNQCAERPDCVHIVLDV